MSIGRTGAHTVAIALVAICVVAAVGGAQSPSAAAGPPEVGQEVADFTLADLEERQHSLADRLGTGPVVLVFFRGAW
jgi:hypothetical protein